MKKFVIYTVIFGEPGRFNIPEISLPPEISLSEVDRICYTDFNIEGGCHQVIPVRNDKYIKNDFYDMRITSRNRMSAVMQQRHTKIIIPDEIFNNYEYSAYVDCKRPLGVDFERSVNLLKPGSSFLTRKHPKRDCVYDEAEFCIEKKGVKGNVNDIKRQMKYYQRIGYPAHDGLYYTAILFRRHTERLKVYSRLWWEQLVRFSHRDQISLPFIRWKHGLDISTYRDS